MRKMRTQKEKDMNAPIYTKADILNTNEPLKKSLITLLVQANVTHNDMRDRYLEYYVRRRNLSLKKATDKYNNDLKMLKNPSVTFNKLGEVITVVLEESLYYIKLGLMDKDGETREEKIDTHGFQLNKHV